MMEHVTKEQDGADVFEKLEKEDLSKEPINAPNIPLWFILRLITGMSNGLLTFIIIAIVLIQCLCYLGCIMLCKKKIQKG